MAMAPTALTRGCASSAPRAAGAASAARTSRARTTPRRTGLAEALREMLAHAQRVGDDRQRRIHGCARGEEARVHDVEVVDLVSAAVHVQRRRRRISAEAHGAVLVRHARERNALAEEEVAAEEPLVAVV